MAYNEKLKQSKQKVYNHAIATKILDLMEKLRLDENENSSRRWIWELLQNAKDVANEDAGVSVEIKFEEYNGFGCLEFKHNGKPFSIDNLAFLIEQVSTKDRNHKGDDNVKTTGKFGTGFLTTHLLSEVVEIESFVKEPDEPYRKFKLSLDRSGRTIDEIINSVNDSLKSLENIDSQELTDQYISTDYNTVFRYMLDQNGIEVAKKGLSDLHISEAFVLTFLPELKTIKITNENILYEISRNIYTEGENIQIYTVLKNTQNEISETNIALLSKNNTNIAVEIEYINSQIYLIGFNSMLPKLFCDFPLIGTEEFSFPVIINSPSFNPNEPRNGIYLTDKFDNKIIENKEILNDAVELYNILLEYASINNWGNIHLMAKIPNIEEKEWISKTWLKNEVIDPIRENLLTTPIVDTEKHGRVSILNQNGEPNIWFPSASKEIIRDGIWDLANSCTPAKLPRRADVEVWYQIIWFGCNRLTLEVITEFIQKNENVNKISEQLIKTIEVFDWLNIYYNLINMDEKFLEAVINDKYAVIPNQDGILKIRSHLKIDNQIEEEYKNVLLILNVNSKDYLLHKSIFTGSEIKYNVKNQEEIINEISEIIQDNANNNVINACDYLITLFSNDIAFPKKRERIFEFCKLVERDGIKVKRNINKWSEKIWIEVDKKKLKEIAKIISETENIKALTEKLAFEDTIQMLSWLNEFISFLAMYEYDYLLNYKNKPILPNQNGEFRIKDDLFLDDGEISETLKDISAELGYDFRNELLNVHVYINLSQNRTKSQVHVAEEIVRLITPKFAEFPRTFETKNIFKKLYLWFIKNEKKAEESFGELYRNKHKLWDDDEMAESIEKSVALTNLMSEFDIEDLSTLRQVLQANKVQSIVEKREQITQETLVSLGVTSICELEEAMSNKEIASKYIHLSTPTVEMFKYVQGLIGRAKANIIEYLKTRPDYDCSEMEELATTVIGGIKKDGLTIHIVVRPSDNEEVIVYYSSEKDALDYANAELWIDNGKTKPRHLTLGKILKLTGINKIPVITSRI